MKNRLENALVILLLLLACVTGLAWLQSRHISYQRTWSDGHQQSCGRFASMRGRLLWQQCDLAPFPALPQTMLRWPVVMPGDFVVGTNPAGERVLVDCIGVKVPFAFPESGLFIGWTSRSASSTDGAKQTRWSARWSEVTVCYWLLLVLLLIDPVIVGIRGWSRRMRTRAETIGT